MGKEMEFQSLLGILKSVLEFCHSFSGLEAVSIPPRYSKIKEDKIPKHHVEKEFQSLLGILKSRIISSME